MTMISREEIKDALLRSGYLLESRVEGFLWEKGYPAEANSPYPDPREDKARELDVYAISGFHTGPEEMDYIFSVLLIECVNNPQPVTFIMKQAQIGWHNRVYDVKVSGVPVKFPRAFVDDRAVLVKREVGQDWLWIGDVFGFDDFHHYMSEKQFATQYCSFQRKRKKEQWMALHRGPHFESFRKLTDATDYHATQHFEAWERVSEDDGLNLQYYYPILVLQGELLRATPTGRTVTLEEGEEVQFRRTVVDHEEERTYTIDVVTEAGLPKLVEQIDKEMRRLAGAIGGSPELVRRTIQALAKARSGDQTFSVRW